MCHSRCICPEVRRGWMLKPDIMNTSKSTTEWLNEKKTNAMEAKSES